jgi:hypothetical protein
MYINSILYSQRCNETKLKEIIGVVVNEINNKKEKIDLFQKI